MEPAPASPPAPPPPPPAKVVRRQPLVAMLLSFIAPGLGHLYVGRAGTAFAIGLVSILVFPLWVVAWSTLDFDSTLFLVGLLVVETGRRFASGLWAALIARRVEAMPLLKWQRPLAYGTFLLLFFLTDGNVQGYVFNRFARPLGVPTNAEAPLVKQKDSIWIVRTGPSHVPRKGALVVFRRIAPEQSSAVFVIQAAPVIGRVVAMGGDEVEVTPQAVSVNGVALPNSAGGMSAAKEKLREGQVFVLSSNHGAESSVDSRDTGPLPVGDYLGEIALVQPSDAPGWQRITGAKETRLK